MPSKNNQRKTSEERIQEFKEVHGDKYDYSQSIIENSRSKIKIICPNHGVFFQRISDHKKGHGCKKCGFEKVRSIKRISQDEFINRCEQLYPNKFLYHKVDYKNNDTKVTIVCKEHGDFEVIPYSFLSTKSGIKTYGCKQCYYDSKKSSLDEVLTKFKKVHGDKYDYSLIEKIDGFYTIIPIICPKHGKYETTVAIHAKGYNCPICNIETKTGGYNETHFSKYPEEANIEGTLYLVRFSNKSKDFIKVGISKCFHNRFSGYSKDYNIEILDTVETSLYEAFKLEQEILKDQKHRHVPKEQYFKGRYECFKLVKKDEILEKFQKAKDQLLETV